MGRRAEWLVGLDWHCRRPALCSAVSTRAAQSADWPPGVFDRPVAVQTLAAGTGADPLPEIRCTVYADLIVRESGTDSPAPDAATLLARTSPPKRAACGRKAGPGAIAVETAGFGFKGRKGGYLLFEASDPNGAVPFMVLDARSGRVLASDSTRTGSVQSLELADGALHLRFTHAINGSCSLLQDTASCWAKMAREGAIPDALAKAPPPKQACAASYRKAKIGADDPSIVFYDVDFMLSGAAAAEVRPSAAIGCDPTP